MGNVTVPDTFVDPVQTTIAIVPPASTLTSKFTTEMPEALQVTSAKDLPRAEKDLTEEQIALIDHLQKMRPDLPTYFLRAAVTMEAEGTLTQETIDEWKKSMPELQKTKGSVVHYTPGTAEYEEVMDRCFRHTNISQEQHNDRQQPVTTAAA
jgi:hypothetical protein